LGDEHDAYGDALADVVARYGLHWLISPSMVTNLRKCRG
jgi:hypothetical protein